MPKGRIVGAIHTVFNCLALEIFVGNTVLLALALIRGGGQAETLVSTSFSAALFVLGFILLWSLRASHSRLDGLDSLERDILFHKISEEDAKQRLEAEHLGHELCEWLTGKVAVLRAKANTLVDQARSAEQLLQDNSSTDERIAKIKSYMREYESSFSAYDSEVNKLLDWLLIARNLNRVTADPFYQRALLSSAESIKDCHQEVTAVWRQMNSKLLAAVA